MLSVDILLYAMLGGILPAVFWLSFWLKEDRHHEPRRKILGTFFAGMLMVFPAIVLQHLVSLYLPEYTFTTFIFWAFIEEALKWSGAFLIALRSRFNDEPVDSIVYLITAALGFAALENTLFLIEPLTKGHHLIGVATSGLRFIGASLLHVLSSGVVGIALAFAFYKNKLSQYIHFFVGMLLATLLHALFNTFIISFEDRLIFIFSSVWIGIILVLVIIEKIKKIKNIPHI
jgi:RsiW-degrading membrane proteinase PrsW (M82 family)